MEKRYPLGNLIFRIIFFLAAVALLPIALAYFFPSGERIPTAPSIGKPDGIRLDYYGASASIDRDAPHFARIVGAVEDGLRQTGSLDHIHATDDPTGFPPDNLGYDLYLALRYENPVKLNFIRDREVRWVYINLPGSVFMSGELEKVLDELLLRERGVTRSLTADQIVNIEISPCRREETIERVRLSEPEDFSQLMDAFNGIAFTGRVSDSSASSVIVTISLKDGRTITIYDHADTDLLRVIYYFETAELGMHTEIGFSSPVLAGMLRSYRRQFEAVRNRPPLGAPGPRMVRPGSSYPLYSAPTPETLQPPPGEIAGGTTVEVLEVFREWARVKSGEIEGWIPWWYLEGDAAAPVRDLDSLCRVLNRDAEGLLYPDGPVIIDLTRGRLLEPLLAWGDWVKVRIFQYSVPSTGKAWLPVQYLSAVGGAEPLEGLLKAGSTVYNVFDFELIGQTRAEAVTGDQIVLIINQREGLIQVDGGAGWYAWTSAENVIFDFQLNEIGERVR